MKHKPFFLILSIAVISVLLPITFAMPLGTEARTEVISTVISADTTWTLSGSPYVVISGSIIVSNGVKLTIEPGVIVKFDHNNGISVLGELSAKGTADQPIIFTSYNDDERGGKEAFSNSDPQPGDWRSIHVSYGGKAAIENAIINYGGIYEIYLAENQGYIKPNIANAVSKATGAITSADGITEISHATITNNIIGIKSSSGENPLSIHNSNIFGNVNYGFYNDEDLAIDATNNYWGSDTGPWHETANPAGQGDKIYGDVSFDPWIGKKTRLPVIIIPGVIASYLDNNDPVFSEVWPNLAKMVLTGEDSYLYELEMEPSGYPKHNLIPTDIFRKIVNRDIFGGLIEELENKGYEENKDLFVFPYDWRLDLRWVASESPIPSVATLKEKIEEVLQKTGAEKVNIIAHSMGGLVAKTYMKYNGDDKVDTFIDIATPHLGSPKAFKMLMYGDDMGLQFIGFGVNTFTMQNISKNMPSVYQLLPSQAYQNLKLFSSPDQNYASYISDVYDLDNNGVKGKLDYEESRQFMKNEELNAYLLGEAETLHSKIDNYQHDKTYNIISCGLATIGQIYVLNKEKNDSYEYGLRFIDGDTTVPFRSQDALQAQRYYIKGTEHGNVPSAEGLKQLAVQMLEGNAQNFDLGAYPAIARNDNFCRLNGTQISFHSPIDLHIYDGQGGHAGKNEAGDLEANIPGVVLEEIGGNQFAFLPAGQEYSIEGSSKGQGSFNARIQQISDSEYIKQFYFNNISLSSSTKVKVEVAQDFQSASLKIDNEADGIYESSIMPSSILYGATMQDQEKPLTQIADNAIKGNETWLVSPAEITLTADDGDGSGILKTEYSLSDDYWQVYTGPFEMDTEGESRILFRSIDKAGNIEDVRSADLKIDISKPQISNVFPVQGYAALHSDKFDVTYTAEDTISGIASTSVYMDSALSTGTLDMFDLRPGEHTIMVWAEDRAGNGDKAIIGFKVIATLESLKKDIERLYSQKNLNAKAKDILLRDLENIEKMSEKLKTPYIKNGLLRIRLEILSKQVEILHKLNWVNEKAYDIIRENIIFIKENL